MYENTSKVLVTQRIEPLEVFTDFESSNKYEIMNAETGKLIGFAAEKITVSQDF